MKKYSSALHNTLPFVIMITYTFIYIEIFSYVGFLRNFFLVDSRFFVFMAMGMVAIDVYYGYNARSRKNNSTNDLVYRLSNLFLPVQVVVYLILKMVEGARYNNYIYSTYHLQPDNMINGIVFGISIAILYQAKRTKKYLRLINFRFLRHNKSLVEFVFLSILLSLSLFTAGLTTIKDAISNDIYILTHADTSYGEKMDKHWGLYYRYMTFIKSNTPEDAVIAIPPQELPWLSSGNYWLTRYFLYPRKLVQGSRYSIPTGVDYIMVDKGEWNAPETEYGWPKVEVYAKKIIYLENETKNIYNAIYTPGNNKESWGLIQLE